MKPQKWTTQYAKKCLKEAYKELDTLPKGSKKWNILYAQIQYVEKELQK
ncbi:MAG: hypothetical protein MJ152_02670 [Clostridia bacterium]|nr:hypothetical protein [Clostridia bacterium]